MKLLITGRGAGRYKLPEGTESIGMVSPVRGTEYISGVSRYGCFQGELNDMGLNGKLFPPRYYGVYWTRGTLLKEYCET